MYLWRSKQRSNSHRSQEWAELRGLSVGSSGPRYGMQTTHGDGQGWGSWRTKYPRVLHPSPSSVLLGLPGTKPTEKQESEGAPCSCLRHQSLKPQSRVEKSGDWIWRGKQKMSGTTWEWTVAVFLKCSRHHGNALDHHLTLLTSLGRWGLYYPHFTDEQTEA